MKHNLEQLSKSLKDFVDYSYAHKPSSCEKKVIWNFWCKYLVQIFAHGSIEKSPTTSSLSSKKSRTQHGKKERDLQASKKRLLIQKIFNVSFSKYGLVRTGKISEPSVNRWQSISKRFIEVYQTSRMGNGKQKKLAKISY